MSPGTGSLTVPVQIFYSTYNVHVTNLCVIVDKDADVVGVADGAVCDPRPRPLPVDVDARPTERGVGEVAVVDGDLTLLWYTETVLSDVGGVFRGIKL